MVKKWQTWTKSQSTKLAPPAIRLPATCNACWCEVRSSVSPVPVNRARTVGRGPPPELLVSSSKLNVLENQVRILALDFCFCERENMFKRYICLYLIWKTLFYYLYLKLPDHLICQGLSKWKRTPSIMNLRKSPKEAELAWRKKQPQLYWSCLSVVNDNATPLAMYSNVNNIQSLIPENQKIQLHKWNQKGETNPKFKSCTWKSWVFGWAASCSRRGCCEAQGGWVRSSPRRGGTHSGSMSPTAGTGSVYTQPAQE